MDNILFSQRLKQLREERGYQTQAALARAYDERFPSSRKGRKPENEGNYKGIYGTIKHYENPNWTGSPNLGIVYNLCKLLGCSIDYLLGEIDCHTHDLQYIHSFTGLSEEAVVRLSHYRYGVLSRWISGLLESDELSRLVRYLQTFYERSATIMGTSLLCEDTLPPELEMTAFLHGTIVPESGQIELDNTSVAQTYLRYLVYELRKLTLQDAQQYSCQEITRLLREEPKGRFSADELDSLQTEFEKDADEFIEQQLTKEGKYYQQS